MYTMWHTSCCEYGPVFYMVRRRLIALSGDELPTYTVRCVEIKKKHGKPNRAGNLDGEPAVSWASKALRTLVSLFQSKSGTPSTFERPVTANTTGPLSWVTLLGFLLSVTVFIASIIFGDGMSMTATILLSLLSTLTGIANKWSLKLPKKPEGEAPPGDTVIRYPNGSYLVVKCDETIARELFFAPEEIQYWLNNPAVYRMISLLGTIVLMLGIIALANAKLQLQFAWAGAYIIINAAHWIAAAVPPKMHWDLSCYQLSEQGIQGGPTNGNFTEALWKAIVLTKSTRWVKNGKAAPQTGVWDEWLTYADDHANYATFVDNTQLIDPIFPDDRPTRAGKVWLLPKDWDPRNEWKKLSDEAELAKVKGAIPPNEAA